MHAPSIVAPAVSGIFDAQTKAARYVLIGGAVLVGTFVAWQAFVTYMTYKAGKKILSTPTGRRVAAGTVGALVGGPAGAATAASLVSNRRSKGRRKRTSRRR